MSPKQAPTPSPAAATTKESKEIKGDLSYHYWHEQANKGIAPKAVPKVRTPQPSVGLHHLRARAEREPSSHSPCVTDQIFDAVVLHSVVHEPFANPRVLFIILTLIRATYCVYHPSIASHRIASHRIGVETHVGGG